MKKQQEIIIAVVLTVAMMFLFMIAPCNSKDMSAFTGRVFAHRGYFDNENGIPENSLAAFSAAIDNGLGIELDVALSKDSAVMVFHDANLQRVCGVYGKTWEYACAEL